MAVEFTRATMAKLLAILCLGLYLVQQNTAQVFDNCLTISNCFVYFEGNCDNQGRRLVCINWATFTGCDHAAAVAAERVCRQNDFVSSTTLAPNTLICSAANQLVPGGTDFSFGIDDGVRPITGSGGPTSINILGYSTSDGRPAAMCSDYTNVCAATGNNDIRLTFRVGACPAVTTTTTTTTTPMPPGCVCDPWVDWGPCSATCGTGTREQRRTCRNCPAGVPLIQFAPCTVPRSCSIDGMWGNWMPWSTCFGPCNGQGTRTRSRVCNNPIPSGPDARACVGSPTGTENCFVSPPCATVPPPPPPPPPSGNLRRRCRQAARRSCPRGRRGRSCRRRSIRRCISNGGP